MTEDMERSNDDDNDDEEDDDDDDDDDGTDDDSTSTSKEQELEEEEAEADKGRRFDLSDCGTSNYRRLIHDETTWKMIQDTYGQAVEGKRRNKKQKQKQKPQPQSHRTLRGGEPSTSWKRHHNEPLADHRKQQQQQQHLRTPQTSSLYTSGFQVPYVVKDDGPHGRSLYALTDIPKGTTVWKPINYAKFFTEEEFVTFMNLLPHDVQCDVLLWAYPTTGGGRPVVALDMDDGSYMNHASTPEELNVDGNSAKATRNIQAGEELLTNYTQFFKFHKSTDWFETIRNRAWDTPDGNNQQQPKHNKSIENSQTATTDYYVSQGAPPTVGVVPSVKYGNGLAGTNSMLQQHHHQQQQRPHRPVDNKYPSVASSPSSLSSYDNSSDSQNLYDDVFIPLLLLCVVPLIVFQMMMKNNKILLLTRTSVTSWISNKKRNNKTT
jgi:hypothetical protein